MSTIAPLLRMEPGEVLINLMTKDVRRFIESPEQETQASFDKLFGRSGVKARVAGLKGLERDDAVVEEYGASVRAFGVFKYVCSAIVLHPERDRTHFHLVYGTRHRKGVEVFKDAEKKAIERALDAPWDKWAVFLHPEQRQLVMRDYSGPARVAGPAGTGRTVVALHRAVHLARAVPDGRILLATFSEPLAYALRANVKRLIGNEPHGQSLAWIRPTED